MNNHRNDEGEIMHKNEAVPQAPATPSFALLRSVTIQPTKITAVASPLFCPDDNVKVYPLVTSLPGTAIELDFDNPSYKGYNAHLEFYHGKHKSPTSATTTTVEVNGVKVDEVTGYGCPEPTLRKTPTFKAPGGAFKVKFIVTASSRENGASSYGLFALGRGADPGQPLNPDTVLVIEPMLRLGLLPI